ncbi:hypothetical protein BDV3_000061 [Batrachochytrium dendrobatidis]|uniref:Cilia- and flagella-associated protein 44 n=1 Tax=Batrachochytrium dendrobatidis (strain JEL423) TaxID=403673 RepID=A0A177WB89_BATDL|nr:hypothetical protein BDEG_21083 [Batrachochytrium dendrobatidis JEL423]
MSSIEKTGADDQPVNESPHIELPLELESLPIKKDLENVPLTDDFYYNANLFENHDIVSNKRISSKSISLFHSFGFSSHKRNNIHFLDENTILSFIGNVLIFMNLRTGEQKHMMGLREGSIGAVAIHPMQTYFAVAEIFDSQPHIYVFEYPSLKLYRVLRNGAEKGYSDLCFNTNGDKISSVAIDPDYMLTIWDWKQEKVMLRSKAFSQDVFRVAFSPENDGILTTSGMGHIKFWRMSLTFTGLKLQGYLGKFGATELSDIAAFIQLPDGKVLSSTETGNMLLWDGGMIKCEIGVKGRRLCHQGKIESILLVEGEVITAGEDGLVRVWDFETIDNADGSAGASSSGGGAIDSTSGAGSLSQSRIFEMEPIDEVLITKDVKIKSIVRYLNSTHNYIVQDQQGHLFCLDLNKRSSDKILSFHAGPVASVDTSPTAHIMASLGSDGNLRMYDYAAKKMLNKGHFSAGGTCMSFLPITLDCTGNTLIAGFADGVMRILSYTSFGIILQHVFKPHCAAITCISVSKDGSLIATGSNDKSVFLFRVDKTAKNNQEIPYSRSSVKITPLGVLSLPDQVVKVQIAPDYELDKEKFKFSASTDIFPNDKKLIVGNRLFVLLENGSLYSAFLSSNEVIDTSVTFEIAPAQIWLKKWTVILPEIPVSNALQNTTDDIKQALGKHPASNPQVLAPNTISSLDIQGQKKMTTEQASNGLPLLQEQGISADQSHHAATSNSKTDQPALCTKESRGLIINSESLITAIHYAENGYFLMGIINTDGEAEVRLCHVLMPAQSRLLLVYKSAITDICLTKTNDYLLIGTADGACAIIRYNQKEFLLKDRPNTHETYQEYLGSFNNRINTALEQQDKNIQSNSDNDLTESLIVNGQFWVGHGHDVLQGRVNMVRTSFDNAFLCSVGNDGGVFVWRIHFNDISFCKPTTAKIEDQSNQLSQPEDITDSNTYTIQEAKVKSEKDREAEQAEEKKKAVRNYIQDLRAEFIKLIGENDKLPSEKACMRKDLCVDPYLHADIERDTLEKIFTLRKEMAWVSEKVLIGLTKLREKYLGSLQTERIEFKAFETNHTLSTYRTMNMDQSVETMLQSLLKTPNRIDTTPHARNLPESRTPGMSRDTEGGSPKQALLLTPQYGDAQTPHRRIVKHTEVKSKLELRKQQRAERAIIWNDLMSVKPDDTYEDPKDVAAIRYAQHHMGDYRLKTANNYIVPENERIDADKKKKQILLLRESIISLKEQYNKQVLKLRSQKMSLVDTFTQYNIRFAEINAELMKLGKVASFNKRVYTMESSAFPEHREKVAPTDIIQFQNQQQEESVHRNGHNDMLDAFGTGSAVPVQNQSIHSGLSGAPVRTDGSTLKKYNAEENRPSVGVDNGNPAAFENSTESRVLSETDAAARSDAPTPLELEKTHIKITKLLYEESEIAKSIEKHIQTFDGAVEQLARERITLDGDLKFADIKLLLLYQEWVLLKEFETHDTALAEKLSVKLSEKNEVDQKISECQGKLALKKSDIEAIISKGTEIREEFSRLLGENNTNEEYLTKIFTRKIKRSKKKIKERSGSKGFTENNDIDEEDEDSDESVDSSLGSDMEDEDEEFEERCPVDCDRTLWFNVLSQRDKRLDQDELLADIQKSVEALKKENDSLIKKEKIVGIGLKSAEAEIQDFQTQKQRKLNELDVLVPLRFHQIQYLERDMIPSDLSPALVFVNDGLLKLQNRIYELQQEKADIKKQHKELRKQHVSFIKSKRDKQQKLHELSDRAKDVQMLKFGQIVDLEKLEKLGVNKTADELREKLQREDNRRLKEIKEYDNKIEQLKERLTEAIKENTDKVESLVQLKEQQHAIENALNTSQASVTAEYSGPQKKDIDERDRLVLLVQSQAQQIDALKYEIELLIRKPIGRVPNIKTQSTVPYPPNTRPKLHESRPLRHDIHMPDTALMMQNDQSIDSPGSAMTSDAII